MENEPLSSGEQAKVFIFMLLMLPSLLYVFGIIPAVFLMWGIYLLKKNKDFSAVETSAMLVKGYFGILLLVCLGFFLYFVTQHGVMTERYDGSTYTKTKHTIDDAGAVFGISIVLLVYMLIIRFLYLNPLRAHRGWVESNDIFGKLAKKTDEREKLKIIKGESLKAYSVAEELSKWAKLRDEGVVSEEEFKEARSKILRSE